MESNHPSESPTDATTVFERELGELILTSFGRGTAIEDTWEIEVPVPDAPNWRVTIEKVPPDESSYDPTLLEE